MMPPTQTAVSLSLKYRPLPNWLGPDGNVKAYIKPLISQLLSKGKPAKREYYKLKQAQEGEHDSQTFEDSIPYSDDQSPANEDCIIINDLERKDRAAFILDGQNGQFRVMVVTLRGARGLSDLRGTVFGQFFAVVFFWVPTGRADREVAESDKAEREADATAALSEHGIDRASVKVIFCRVDSLFTPPCQVKYSVVKIYETTWINREDILGRIGCIDGGDFRGSLQQ
jgi:hypothetical protein